MKIDSHKVNGSRLALFLRQNLTCAARATLRNAAVQLLRVPGETAVPPNSRKTSRTLDLPDYCTEGTQCTLSGDPDGSYPVSMFFTKVPNSGPPI